jgi:hypothetical protein
VGLYGTDQAEIILGVGAIGLFCGLPQAERSCPACESGLHERCWSVDPPTSAPLGLLCPCRVVSASLPRHVVVSALSSFGDQGWAVFDRGMHDTVGGWFGLKKAAHQMAHMLNGPTPAEFLASRAEMVEALAELAPYTGQFNCTEGVAPPAVTA